MKIRYTEPLLKDAFQQLVLNNPDSSGPIPDFNMEHPVMAIIEKADGEKSFVSYGIDIEEDGLLVVLMHLFKVDKAIAAWYFSFSNIQHLKIRDSWLKCSITLKHNGNDGDYKFKIMKFSPKNIPNQKRNLQYITDKLAERFDVT